MEFKEKESLPPDQIAEILIEEMRDSFVATESETVEEFEARHAKIAQLYNRSINLLVDQGYKDVVSQALSADWEYFNNLLMKTTIPRVLDNMRDESIGNLFRRLRGELSDTSLIPPDLNQYSQNLPQPFSTLMNHVLFIDENMNMGRYQEMRNATNKLLGFTD